MVLYFYHSCLQTSALLFLMMLTKSYAFFTRNGRSGNGTDTTNTPRPRPPGAWSGRAAPPALPRPGPPSSATNRSSSGASPSRPTPLSFPNTRRETQRVWPHNYKNYTNNSKNVCFSLINEHKLRASIYTDILYSKTLSLWIWAAG